MTENESLTNKIEKGRVEFAYKKVKEVASEASQDAKKYLSHIRKLAPMILTNGLGQTLAFAKAKSKGDKGWKWICKHLTEYLKSDTTIRPIPKPNKDDLVEWLAELDTTQYRYVTQELLSFINWLKRFAEGLIKEKEEKKDKGEE